MSEWYNKDMFRGIPKDELLRLVAKTTASTDHRNDMSLPPEQRKIRIYPAEELMLAARSLIHRPVLINHNMNMVKGETLDAEWIPERQQIETIIRVPKEIVQAYNAGLFTHCSIGHGEREVVIDGDKEIAKGIWFGEISLVIGDGVKAGDPNALVHSFEFKVESIPAEVKPVEPVVDYKAKFEEAEKKLKEVSEAYSVVVKGKEELEKTVSKKIEAARREGKTEVIEKVESVLPKLMLARNGASGLNRLTQDIKRKLKEAEN